MSLRLWLPLNGDSRNQGVNSYSITTLGTVTYPTGKMGTCLQAGNGNQVVNGLRISSNLTDILANDYSATIWVKPLGSHVHYNGSFLSSGNWNGTKWAFGVSQDNTKVDVLCNGYNIWITCDVPVNTWTHLACVRTSDGKVTLYKNGEYVGYTTRTDHPQSDADFTCVGRETYANGYFSFNGCINDLRVYDHALSAEEVKKISQGLVLHYPLNRKGFGNDNLILNSRDEKSGSSATAQWFRWNISSSPLTSNQTYTLSFDAQMSVTSDVFYIGWANNDSTQEVLQYGVNVGNTYKRYSFTGQTTKTNINSIVISNYKGYGRGNNNNTSGILKIRNIKLEVGAKSTTWIPNTSDSLYTSLNIGDTSVKDISGFRNNGTKLNSPTISTDTQKYSVSTHLDGTNQVIQIPNLSTLITDGIFTFNIWFKRVEAEPSSKAWETILGGPSGFELETNPSNSSHAATVKAYSWGGGTFNYDFDVWNMLTMVRTTSGTTFYLNGEQKLTGSAGSIPNGNYFIGSWKVATSQNYKGYVSDARIYCTALSADDIQELYDYNNID